MGIRTSFSATEALMEKRHEFWPDPVAAKVRAAEKRYRQIWLAETDRKIESLDERINRLWA